MTPPLSPRAKQLVERFFSAKDISEASLWLEAECGCDVNAHENWVKDVIRKT